MEPKSRDAEQKTSPVSASRLLAATPSSTIPIPAPVNSSVRAVDDVDSNPVGVVVENPPACPMAETIIEPRGRLSASAPGAALASTANSAAVNLTGAAADEALGSIGLRIDTLVDRTYRLERSLGVGGMGVVALATDERLDRKVAIKFIRPELFAFPEMRTFFQTEARAMARVAHRNVLSVYAFGEHDGTPYFVMEYVDGVTVDQWLKESRQGGGDDALGALDDAIRILEQSCLGVEAIHATSTVHRDIKPSNLLVDGSFRVAVGDLGVARAIDAGQTGSFVVGSASYMAPEAAFGEDEDPELACRRDIYALGCVAYELFTGRPPFVGPSDVNILSQHVMNTPAPPSSIAPGLPLGYDDVILRALAKDPRDRYESVGAFRRALLAEHTGDREPERILIADDDDDWRAIITSRLAERFPNAIIDEVGDGEAALAAFDARRYSVVLVDLQMPAMDGVKTTLLMRSVESAARTPIIVLTAAGGPREWRRLSAIGADAFLVKPVNADDLELVIRRTLRSGRPSARPPESART